MTSTEYTIFTGVVPDVDLAGKCAAKLPSGSLELACTSVNFVDTS